MNDKRLTKSYKSHNESQSSHCLVAHEDVHLNYKWYKVSEILFRWSSKGTQVPVYTNHTVFVFFKFPFLFYFILLKEINKTNKQHVKKK